MTIVLICAAARRPASDVAASCHREDAWLNLLRTPCERRPRAGPAAPAPTVATNTAYSAVRSQLRRIVTLQGSSLPPGAESAEGRRSVSLGVAPMPPRRKLPDTEAAPVSAPGFVNARPRRGDLFQLSSALRGASVRSQSYPFALSRIRRTGRKSNPRPAFLWPQLFLALVHFVRQPLRQCLHPFVKIDSSVILEQGLRDTRQPFSSSSAAHSHPFQYPPSFSVAFVPPALLAWSHLMCVCMRTVRASRPSRWYLQSAGTICLKIDTHCFAGVIFRKIQNSQQYPPFLRERHFGTRKQFWKNRKLFFLRFLILIWLQFRCQATISKTQH